MRPIPTKKLAFSIMAAKESWFHHIFGVIAIETFFHLSVSLSWSGSFSHFQFVSAESSIFISNLSSISRDNGHKKCPTFSQFREEPTLLMNTNGGWWIRSCGTVAQLVERPSKGPNYTDVSSNLGRCIKVVGKKALFGI